MIVAVNYQKIEEQPAQADRLLKIFMRLEFALKEIGYCRAARKQAAEVAWDNYTNQRLGSAFFDSVKSAGRAQVLIQDPPKRQIVDMYGTLAWEQVAEVSNTQELVGSLRRVRNNLFHGGKSGDPDKDRNDELVKNALNVIDHMLQCDDDLRAMFEGNY